MADQQRTSSANSAPGTPGTPIVTMANIRSPTPLAQLPQVQVIPQSMHSPPYLSNFPSYNQQIMLQNAAVAMAQQQLNMAAAMQGRPPSVGPTSPGLMSPSSQAVFQPGMIVSTTVAPTSGNGHMNKVSGNGKMQTPQGQATALVGGKPAVMSAQQAAQQPLVLGQLGVFSGQGGANQNYVAQQAAKGQGVSIAAHQGQPQLITSQAPLRLSQPQLVTNTGQIITSQPMLTNQAVLQAMASLQQGIPLAAHQPLLNHAQTPAILAGQSLYIRTANPIQAQQGMMANMQVWEAALAGSMKKMEMPQNLQVTTKPNPGSVKGVSQSGKTLLPSKSATAKIPPTHMSQVTKLNIPTVIPKQPKSRAKSKSSSSSTSSQNKTSSSAVSHSKPATPTSQPTSVVQPVKSQSDSEVETTKKSSPPPELTSTKEKSRSLTTAEANDSLEEEKDCMDGIDDNDKPPVITKEVESPMDTTPEKPPPPLEPVAIVEKQKAIVKPHILTHIIEGFVIQEGPEPFPVQRSSLLTEFIPPKPSRTDKDSDDESLIDLQPPLLEPEGLVVRSPEPPQPNMLKCEYCGKVATAVKFRRSKRFCSMACAKRYNVACSRRVGLFKNKAGTVKLVKKRKHPLAARKGWRSERGARLEYNITSRLPGEEASSSNSGQEETSSSPGSPSHTPDMDIDQMSPTNEPSKWSVGEVYEFIKSLPGCSTYAEEFLSQEIDGQALLLLKEDHLMTAMNIKLGPALKICARITSLKDECV